jgi:hypothetical protein
MAENTQRRKHQGKKRERDKRKEEKKTSIPRNKVASHKRQPFHKPHCQVEHK